MLEVITGVISKIIGNVIPDKAAQAAAQIELTKMAMEGDIKRYLANVDSDLKKYQVDADLEKGQMEINKEEAKSNSFFVSGARPFILWGTGVAFILPALFPYLSWFFALCGVHVPPLPVIDNTMYSAVLMGLLGLSGWRTLDKIKGVAKK